MECKVTTAHLAKHSTDCIIVGLYQKGGFTPAAETIDKLSRGQLTKWLKLGDFNANLGQTLLLYDVAHLPTRRLLLVGCGKKQPLSARDYRRIIHASLYALKEQPLHAVTSCLVELQVKDHDTAWAIKQAVLVASDTYYTFTSYKSQVEQHPKRLKKLMFYAPKLAPALAKRAVQEARAMADGMALTKNLANTPSNICTPRYLAEQALLLAKDYPSLKVKIVDKKAMQKLGMNALLAVAQGSREEPRLICLEYQGSGKKKDKKEKSEKSAGCLHRQRHYL